MNAILAGSGIDPKSKTGGKAVYWWMVLVVLPKT
jgi:hypothetical protein